MRLPSCACVSTSPRLCPPRAGAVQCRHHPAEFQGDHMDVKRRGPMSITLISRSLRFVVAAGAACFLLPFSVALAGPLRIVTYNIEADTGGYTAPRPGLDTVLEGIGNENVNVVMRP